MTNLLARRTKLGGGGGPPAPPGPLPFITSLGTLNTLRNDIAGEHGFRATLGAADITITALGRWVSAGNSLTHTIKVVSAAYATLASVLVDTSGATPDAFIYADLVTPVTLLAGAGFYIVSTETLGGDQWLNNTVVNTTAAAAVTHYVYNYNDIGVPGYGFVVPNFKYTV